LFSKTATVVVILIMACRAPAFIGADSVADKYRKFVSADSAVILCPAQFTLLDKAPVTYTVRPVCPVSAVDLLVHYYPFRTDTLARIAAPPFTTTWHYESLPDQDQLHLQFGYILYHSNGDTILSPPLPHRWVIDRNRKTSPKRYVCKQPAGDDSIAIDGELKEWGRFHAATIGALGRFRCCWTAPDFYFAAEVYDSNVTIFDRIELCFDLQQTRTPFLGPGHRVIAFGPTSRSFCWAVDTADTGAVLLDSVIMLVKEQTLWRSSLTGQGYVVEGRIPFFTLTALEFPPKEFGFDVAVVNRDTLDLNKETVCSWSGTPPSSLHNPSEWGTIKLRQLFLPLKLLLIAAFFFIIAVVGVMVALIAENRRKEYYLEKRARAGLSPAMQSIMTTIEGATGQKDLSPDAVARACGCSVSLLQKTCADELHASCETLITLARIKKAKTWLAGSSMTMDEVAHAAGFADTAAFARMFKSYAGVHPQQWKENRLKDSLDGEEADEAAGPGHER